MKPFLFLLPSLFLIPLLSYGQSVPFPCNTSGNSAIKNAGVLEQWEYKADKKTKKKTFLSVREYDANGCMVKLITPNASESETYFFKEWAYNAGGLLLAYREGKIDKDSAKINSFSEGYAYSSSSLLSRYRKDVYESEMSQTVTKWEYEYSDKGEKRQVTFSQMRVRKDSILNDEIKYDGNGTPKERTTHYFFPKGVSELTKYNSKGLPVDFMRYDKGKVTSHKVYVYVYNKQDQLTEETITDGVAKTSEKKKYEKDKIIYTQLNSKGKVINTSSLPYSLPKAISFPPMPELTAPVVQQNDSPKNITTKEKTDKKKNKIVESYSGGKLISTDIYDEKGLILETIPAEGNFSIKYEYTFE